ncbi:hypothetical protein DY102_07260 [Apilactobacillus timberlakei]|uniref:hypothetical protein n=1 Tax=Apilactobacillus timberlakei TaxID=2008380 RepID=UPI00112691A9|nr:hypothetical protein [Apilactobacillus timberlakei]TPR21482.1 hypothetical protein DY102_07260 [Apilactobacillus timberlakei]
MLSEQAINYIEIKQLKFINSKICDKRLVLQNLNDNNLLINEILKLNKLISEINKEIKIREGVY